MEEAATDSDSPGRSPGRRIDANQADVDLIDAAGLAPDRLAWLRGAIADALAHLGSRGELRVRVVADAEMTDAHDRWIGDPATTDVLTFDLGTTDRHLDADVIVCLDEARRQADARGHAPERELLLYVIHAVLHCLGHDDHDEAGAAGMHRLEDETLEAIGVGATYRAPHPGAIA
jgi:probable rRNA maturation factor